MKKKFPITAILLALLFHLPPIYGKVQTSRTLSPPYSNRLNDILQKLQSRREYRHSVAQRFNITLPSEPEAPAYSEANLAYPADENRDGEEYTPYQEPFEVVYPSYSPPAQSSPPPKSLTKPVKKSEMVRDLEPTNYPAPNELPHELGRQTAPIDFAADAIEYSEAPEITPPPVEPAPLYIDDFKSPTTPESDYSFAPIIVNFSQVLAKMEANREFRNHEAERLNVLLPSQGGSIMEVSPSLGNLHYKIVELLERPSGVYTGTVNMGIG